MSKNTSAQKLPTYPEVNTPASLHQNNQLGKTKVSWMKSPHLAAHRTRTYTPTLSWSPKRFGAKGRPDKTEGGQEIFYTRSDSINKNHVLLTEPHSASTSLKIPLAGLQAPPQLKGKEDENRLRSRRLSPA